MESKCRRRGSQTYLSAWRKRLQLGHVLAKWSCKGVCHMRFIADEKAQAYQLLSVIGNRKIGFVLRIGPTESRLINTLRLRKLRFRGKKRNVVSTIWCNGLGNEMKCVIGEVA